MNGKKTLPLFVIATLMLSLLPSIMFANAAAAIALPVAGTHYEVGDTIEVTGTGVVAGTTVKLYWDDAALESWNGVKGLRNSTTGKSSGAFEVWTEVPEATYGAHYLWVKDSSGNTASVLVNVDATVGVSPDSGLSGDTVTVTMHGFPDEEEITIDFNNATYAVVGIATATANSVGRASTTFKVPTPATHLEWADYNVGAYNTTDTIMANATFTVGPVITLSSSSGTVGSIVTVNGRGFLEGEHIVQGDFKIDGVACYITTTDDLTVDATGRIRLNVVIPQTSDTDEYPLTLTSDAGNASADYEVTALAKTSVTPGYGPQASTITVSGVNFPKIKDVEVAVTLNAVSIGTAKTLSDGTFSKTFKVPAIADGTYPIVADAADYNVDDDVDFKVGTMNVILSDDEGPTGLTITLTGNGFTAGKTFNATIGDETLVDSGTISGAGLINEAVMIPQLPVGTYTVTVFDVDTEISLTTTFKVTKTTTVEFSVPSAPVGFVVDLYGYGFADTGFGNLNVVLYNETSAGALDFWWSLDVTDGTTNSTGEFEGTWEVPEELSLGNYFINFTDPQDYAVTVAFTVGDVHSVCTPRKETFKIGDTITFTIEHSFGNQDPYDASILKIYNPSGTLVFLGDANVAGDWVKTGLWYTLPYSAQTAGGNPMVLGDDMPTGTWTWKWVDADGDDIKTGSFAVAASSASETDAKITALATQITALQSSVSTAVQGAQTAATQAGTKADAATAAATAAGAKADAATAAATTAGTKADAATAAANQAATAAKSAADAASGLTTLVYAAIGASLIAALAAIVALMQISRKIA